MQPFGLFEPGRLLFPIAGCFHQKDQLAHHFTQFPVMYVVAMGSLNGS